MHNYSIVSIFDELLNESCFVVVGFRLFIIHRRSQRDIFLASSMHPSVHSFRPYFVSVRNHISVPIGQI